MPWCPAPASAARGHRRSPSSTRCWPAAVVAHTLAALVPCSAWRHAGGAGARRHAVRGLRPVSCGPARLGGALRRVPHGPPRWRNGLAGAAPRARARRLGAGARRRPLPAAAGLGRPPDRRLPATTGGRPAGAAAGRHAQAGAHEAQCSAAAMDRSRQVAGADAADVPPGPAAARAGAAGAPSPTRPAPSRRWAWRRAGARREENLKLTWPADFALAARLLETR
jgi:hypothetical protein